MRRRPRPDNRLSWRDPAMPVLRDYLMPSGERRNVVDADYERRYREHLIETDNSPHHPHYKNDPTYDLKKQRRKL